jgi:DNA-binding transcriptional ArsR family regulator
MAIDEKFLKMTKSLISMLNEDIRIKILIELSENGPLSTRALARRLKTNYRKISYALKQLKEYGFVEETVVAVSEWKKYRFYTVDKDLYNFLLKEVLNIG